MPTLTVALGDESRSAAPAAAQTAARIFGVEPEGMSAEDRDFEIARRFVRFAQAEPVRAARSVNPDRDQHRRSDMFETGAQAAEYGNGGPPGQRESSWAGEEEYGGYGQGEEEYGAYGQGEEEYGAYGQGEEEYGAYGQGEEEYGAYGQGEEEYGGYGQGEEEYGGWGGRGGAVPAR